MQLRLYRIDSVFFFYRMQRRFTLGEISVLYYREISRIRSSRLGASTVNVVLGINKKKFCDFFLHPPRAKRFDSNPRCILLPPQRAGQRISRVAFAKFKRRVGSPTWRRKDVSLVWFALCVLYFCFFPRRRRPPHTYSVFVANNNTPKSGRW